mmetsp:Transcript_25816/g.63241  ORF Transcript_25816/g.63241 Transcript_25816/m.63241 type:complete len:302 (+) Transcript_25816:120-1025(+)
MLSIVNSNSKSTRRAYSCSNLLLCSKVRMFFVVAITVLLKTFIEDSHKVSIPSPKASDDQTGCSSLYSRTAYLISVNETSARTVFSQGILKRVGFSKIKLEMAPNMGPTVKDKTKSNKYAQLSIYKKIASGSEPWGYLFEDDINLCRSQSHLPQTIQFSVLNDLVCQSHNDETCLENQNEDFIYLGICSPEQIQGKGITSRFCGRCAHAYGVSRIGARRLIEYEKSYLIKGKRHFMDAVVDSYCRESGGFPVSDIQCQRIDADRHFGSFLQDQNQFPPIIDTRYDVGINNAEVLEEGKLKT